MVKQCRTCPSGEPTWYSGKNREAAVKRGEIPTASQTGDHDQKGRNWCDICEAWEQCDCGAEDCSDCKIGKSNDRAFRTGWSILKDDGCEECGEEIPNGKQYGCERCGRDFCEECQ